MPAYVIGQPDGARIEVGGAQAGLEIALSEARASLALVGRRVVSGDASSQPGDGDGFLSSDPAGRRAAGEVRLGSGMVERTRA